MRPEWPHSLVLVTASAIVGVAAWSGDGLCLPTVIFFPALWALARCRQTAGLISAAYFLAASRGLPQGVSAFYRTDIWPGLILWVTASSVFVMVHASLWSSGGGPMKGLRYLIVMFLMALPPFGIIGWAHPVTAAGILFPDWGWFGLAAMAAGLAVMATRYRSVAAIMFASAWLCSGASLAGSETARGQPEGWQAIDLRLGNSLGRDGSLARHRELAAMVANQRQRGAVVVILPENALGLLTPTVIRLWQQQLSGSGISLISGAAIVVPDGYDNVLVRISGNDSEILYRERMPVPGSMWQPWVRALGESGGAQAHLFANPDVSAFGQRIAPLICYEQLIVWPILQSMLFDPDLILAVGNAWWTEGTTILAIQRMSAEAWARLFGTALVISFNT